MDVKEFRLRGAEIIDYIVDYLESVSERPVASNVSPGYLGSLLPSSAPETGESFQKIMEDFEKCIMPGITHWQHPRFHAYFPCNCSFPAILAEMMSDSIGSVGYNWNISPSAAELEWILLDWYGKMIGLPNEFLRYADGSKGSGITQTSSSECILISMVAARRDALSDLKRNNPSICEAALLSSLIAYCTTESHSCVEKAAMMSLVNIKILETDSEYRLRGHMLEKVLNEDKKNGLIPFFVSITVGSTSCCACDPVDEIGRVCEAYGVWLHVDAAYGGTGMICPELRYLIKGIEYASTFNVNPGKWFLLNIDCAVMWVKDRSKINESLVVDKTMFAYGSSEDSWGYPCHRRYRALKLFCVIRNYGIEGLQANIRNHVRLAKMFSNYVQSDERFELLTCRFGLVCFRLKGSNELNKKLLMSINASAKLHITACSMKGKYVIRFCVCVERAKEEDITYAWSVFCDFAKEILETKK